MTTTTKYLNPHTGTELEVLETGKTYVTRRYYPAAKHSQASTVVRKHSTYSPVEKMIAKGGFVRN